MKAKYRRAPKWIVTNDHFKNIFFSPYYHLFPIILTFVEIDYKMKVFYS